MRAEFNNSIRLLTLTTAPETIGGFFQKQLALLAENGFAIHAASSPGPGLSAFERIPGVTVHGIPMERAPHVTRDLVSLSRIYRLILKVRPDIVHAHTPKAGLLAMAAGWAARVPIRLYTIHGLPLLTRTGFWRKIIENAERASCSLATAVYVVSPSVQNVALQLGLCNPGKIATLGYGSCAGVDLERFDPAAVEPAKADAVRQQFDIPANAKLLTFFGRLAKDKGIPMLAEAWATLAREYPDLYLLLAGAPDQTDPVADSVMQPLLTHERVRHSNGWIKETPAVYATTTICVLPTLREGLSQVALESAAMGVPLVGTRVPGMVDPVVDGVTGLLVPSGDTAAFIEAIRRVLEDAEFRRSASKAAREHVTSRFSDQRVNQMWLEEYRRLATQLQGSGYPSGVESET